MGTDWISKVFERPDESPPEPEPVKEEEVGDKPMLSGDKNAEKPAFVSSTTATPSDEDAKAPKAPYNLKGEYSPQLPEDIQDERQLLRQKELNFSEAQSFTRLNTGRALSQTKAMAQEILADDYEEMDRLNKEHYSRWESENAAFRADIDAARQLRVNPNNYFQNIGRSGRVSSVLAAAASQMAAGAGNPNMAWNRIKATIDQDITTQKANIELEFAGIETGQNQQDREALMLQKYYGFEEKSRAVAMTALEAQVGVIKQRAGNEMEYQAYQMIRDRARAEAIDASAAALAKNATLYLDQPTHTAYQNLIAANRWKEAQAMLQAAYHQEEGSAQAVDTSIDTYDAQGNPVQITDPPPAQPLGEVVEGPGGPVEAAPQTGAARVARKRQEPKAGPSPEEQAVIDSAPDIAADAQTDRANDPLTPEQAHMENLLGPVEGAPAGIERPADQVAAELSTADAEAAERKLRRRAGAAQTEAGIRQRMTDKVFQQGGYRYSELIRNGHPEAALRGQNINTFAEARDRILDTDDPTIAVFPSYADAIEGLKYDTRTGARAEYERKNPELYEQNMDIPHEGTKTKPRVVESNYVKSGWGIMKLDKAATIRFDQDGRDALRAELNTDFARAGEIKAQADAIAAAGTGSFLGFQITKDGPTWVGTEGGVEMQEKLSGQTGLGIQAMKLLDPSGRLTDKDIEVGKEYMSALLQNKSIKGWDMLTGLYRSATGKDPTKSDLRRVLRKTMVAMSNKLSRAVAMKHVGVVVFDFEQNDQLSRKQNETEKFMRSIEKDD